jgi:hypothetical protein
LFYLSRVLGYFKVGKGNFKIGSSVSRKSIISRGDAALEKHPGYTKNAKNAEKTF